MTRILTTQENILVKETITEIYTKISSDNKFLTLTQILHKFCNEKKEIIKYELFITLNKDFIIKMHKETII